jgi:hypothetical protein
MTDPNLRQPRRLANFLNFLLLIAVAIPAFWFADDMFHHCSARDRAAPLTLEARPKTYSALRPQLCALTYRDPITAVNVIFFVNVCVLFW